MTQKAFYDPIDSIKWFKATDLKANDWNPNVVMTQELRLLERNILTHGWIQPILVSRELTVIDGFHRWSLSQASEALKARYNGLVPVAVLDLDEAEAMLLTVSINRAKGTHLAFRMSDMVRRLVDVHGLTFEAIEAGIGAYKGEVQLLYQEDVWKRKAIDKHQYSEAWAPKTTEKS